MQEATNVNQRFGQNARAIRTSHGVTLNEVALAARNRGMPWSTGRVGDIEAGRVPPQLETLVVLALALTDTTGQPTTVADLFTGHGSVQITDNLTVTAEALHRVFTGTGPADWADADYPSGQERAAQAMRDAAARMRDVPRYYDDQDLDQIAEVERQSGDPERRTARSLGISTDHLTAASVHLWGRSMTAERDRRAEPGASAKIRGHITRTLKAELRAEIERHRNGDD